MLLVIDVGNTHTVLGVYDGERLHAYWRISSEHIHTADECGILVRQLCASVGVDTEQVDGVALASVVPTLTSAFEEMSMNYLHQKPLVVDSDTETGIEICCDDPKSVGADRIANAVAAYELYGGLTIVVDLGTATTFDVVSSKGEYMGGVIAPGIEASAAWLFKQAAKLPHVELKIPPSVIGRNTENSIRAGIIFGTVGQVDEIVRRIEAEMGQKARAVATGGLAHLVAEESKTIQEVNPLLTLEGLRRIFGKRWRTEKIAPVETTQSRTETEEEIRWMKQSNS